eukprot:scaffold149608_cov21-Tisochrysis_lutea.AAC.1
MPAKRGGAFLVLYVLYSPPATHLGAYACKERWCTPCFVLCVQRVNKKFTARRACKERTYTYYLPA